MQTPYAQIPDGLEDLVRKVLEPSLECGCPEESVSDYELDEILPCGCDPWRVSLLEAVMLCNGETPPWYDLDPPPTPSEDDVDDGGEPYEEEPCSELEADSECDTWNNSSASRTDTYDDIMIPYFLEKYAREDSNLLRALAYQPSGEEEPTGTPQILEGKGAEDSQASQNGELSLHEQGGESSKEKQRLDVHFPGDFLDIMEHVPATPDSQEGRNPENGNPTLTVGSVAEWMQKDAEWVHTVSDLQKQSLQILKNIDAAVAAKRELERRKKWEREQEQKEHATISKWTEQEQSTYHSMKKSRQALEAVRLRVLSEKHDAETILLVKSTPQKRAAAKKELEELSAILDALDESVARVDSVCPPKMKRLLKRLVPPKAKVKKKTKAEVRAYERDQQRLALRVALEKAGPRPEFPKSATDRTQKQPCGIQENIHTLLEIMDHDPAFVDMPKADRHKRTKAVAVDIYRNPSLAHGTASDFSMLLQRQEFTRDVQDQGDENHKHICAWIGVLKNVHDVRRANYHRLYPLCDTLFIVLCALICGCKNTKQIASFAIARSSWFYRYAELPAGVPLWGTTYLNILRKVDPGELLDAFMPLLCQLAGSDADEATTGAGSSVVTDADVSTAEGDPVGVLIRVLTGKPVNLHVRVDGKTIRGSGQATGKPVHIISVYDHENHVILDSQAVEAKTNEIPVGTAMLKKLGEKGILHKGVIVTADAMLCQVDALKAICGASADYMVNLKGNQQNAESSLINLIEGMAAAGTLYQVPHWIGGVELGHGRAEARAVFSFDADWFKDKDKWPNLKHFVWIRKVQFFRVTKRQKALEAEAAEPPKARSETNPVTVTDHFYITSLDDTPKNLYLTSRCHWAIENSLHWALDCSFGEDASTISKGNAPACMNILRKVAICLLQATHETKFSRRLKDVSAKAQDCMLYETSLENVLLSYAHECRNTTISAEDLFKDASDDGQRDATGR